MPSFSPRKRRWIEINVAVSVAALLAVVVMLNYLSARHYARWAATAQRAVRLSPQTLRVLSTVTNPVNVTVVFNTRDEETLHTLVVSLLKEYNYVNPRIRFRTVDPVRQPAEAELVLAAHRLGALKNKNFVVFECDGRTRVFYANELADVQFESEPGTDPPEFRKRYVAFRGEALFTSAIFNLANPRRVKIGFIQGHGEHDPEKFGHPHGYARFAQILAEKLDAQIEKVSLIGTNEIPTDCQLLIIAGPRMPYSDAELAKLENFLNQGGRMLVLLNNAVHAARSGLESLLLKWNVAVGDKAILDPKHSPTGNDLLAAPYTTEHPVTKALLADSPDMRVRLVLPRAVGQFRAGAAGPEAPRVEVLVATSESAIEVSQLRDGVPYPNPYWDRRGVFPLIVAVEQGSVKGLNPERGTTRIVVVGDSLCLDNELIESPPANHYFGVLAVSWLLDQPQVMLEGIVPEPLKEYRLIMTEQQLQQAQLTLLLGFPGAVLLLGLLVWWRRKH
ncbi:MAG: GldG family protein [Verrucomicrobiae bacterium]|nr:GldG family protein [Verrucomicrobiae bacterium]MCX7722780.1 GldG family protein [Verrucomicrobiae bacterium]MDW7979421.1 GldG family protein [Verrucomicrobiales bacterium]